MKRFDLYHENDGYRLMEPMTVMAIAATIGAGATAYSAVEQKSAAKKARNAQEQQAMEARRIAAEGKPLEESATLTFQDQMNSDTLGSLGLMVAPDMAKKKNATGLGSSTGGVGLGSTSATSTLGFGS